MSLRLIKSLKQSGATIRGSHQENIPGTNIQGIVFNEDINGNQGGGGQQNQPVCGRICQQKKRRKYAMIGGVVIIGVVSAYFIFKNKN